MLNLDNTMRSGRAGSWKPRVASNVAADSVQGSAVQQVVEVAGGCSRGEGPRLDIEFTVVDGLGRLRQCVRVCTCEVGDDGEDDERCRWRAHHSVGGGHGKEDRPVSHSNMVLRRVACIWNVAREGLVMADTGKAVPARYEE